MRAMNYLTAIFFAFDAVCKMVAAGVLFTPSAYFQVSSSLTSCWQQTCTSLLDMPQCRCHEGAPA